MIVNVDSWQVFCIVFAAMLVVSFIMMKLSDDFYMKDNVVRKFSIMELEVPASPKEFADVLGGLFKLPDDKKLKAIKALRAQLILDFLFMPLAYGSLFLLCLRIAYKTQLPFEHHFFLWLGYLQVIPWMCDIIENIIILKNVRPDPIVLKKNMHANYLRMEAVKWGLALTALVCAVSAICYFWLSGDYSPDSFKYLIIVGAELVVFFVVLILLKKKPAIAN